MHKCWFLWGGSAGTFSLPPNSIHSCAAVKLGSEETEEKSIRVAVWPLIFSLLPFFSSTPPSPHLSPSPSPLFLLSQWVRGGQSILTPSTGQVRTSNIPWIQTFSPSPSWPSNSPPPPHLRSVNLTSVLQSSPSLFSPSPPSLQFLSPVWWQDGSPVFLLSYFHSKCMKNSHLQAEKYMVIFLPTSTCDLHLFWIVREASFTIFLSNTESFLLYKWFFMVLLQIWTGT